MNVIDNGCLPRWQKNLVGEPVQIVTHVANFGQIPKRHFTLISTNDYNAKSRCTALSKRLLSEMGQPGAAQPASSRLLTGVIT